MGKGFLGVLTALAVWCGGALAAEAQNIGVDITGPLAVYSDQTSVLVTANVTNASSYYFWVRVRIAGVLKYNSMTQVGYGSTIDWTCINAQNWPLTEGTQLEFQVRAWTSSTNLYMDTHYVTVSAPGGGGGTFLTPDQKRAPLGVPEEALAWLDRKACEVIG